MAERGDGQTDRQKLFFVPYWGCSPTPPPGKPRIKLKQGKGNTDFFMHLGYLFINVAIICLNVLFVIQRGNKKMEMQIFECIATTLHQAMAREREQGIYYNSLTSMATLIFFCKHAVYKHARLRLFKK